MPLAPDRSLSLPGKRQTGLHQNSRIVTRHSIAGKYARGLTGRKSQPLSQIPSRILLFGEYSILFGSMALSIPFKKFSAGFSFPGPVGYTNPDGPGSNGLLRKYFEWLVNSSSFAASEILDLDGFGADLEKGLFLESSIPRGCGLGSSGALCAAVFRRYPVGNGISGASYNQQNLQEIKGLLSGMESYFHGTSSGLDPLTCYLGRPVLVDAEGNIKMVAVPPQESFPGIVPFIVSAGQPRVASSMVSSFIEKNRENQFRERITGKMMPLVNTCIDSMLKPDYRTFVSAMAELSLFQFRYMGPMITGNLHSLWERGLESGDYCLKLCGAGGGGFFLGFTANMEKSASIFAKSGLEIIPVPIEQDPGPEK
jgi:mevalonate kinase